MNLNLHTRRRRYIMSIVADTVAVAKLLSRSANKPTNISFRIRLIKQQYRRSSIGKGKAATLGSQAFHYITPRFQPSSTLRNSRRVSSCHITFTLHLKVNFSIGIWRADMAYLSAACFPARLGVKQLVVGSVPRQHGSGIGSRSVSRRRNLVTSMAMVGCPNHV